MCYDCFSVLLYPPFFVFYQRCNLILNLCLIGFFFFWGDYWNICLILIAIYKYFLLLGGYDKEEKAARAYDLAALKYWGPTTHINFPVRFLRLCTISPCEKSLSLKVQPKKKVFAPIFIKFPLLCTRRRYSSVASLNYQLSTYEKELEEMKHMSRQEFVANLRRYALCQSM